MLQCLIIDDEPLAHKVILEYAKEIPYINIIGQCYLATESLAFLNNQTIDLIFLDINMPKLKGLDFLRTLHKKPLVIITSAYGEYALEGFELNVCDYLLKPFRFDRFMKATNKAFELFQLQNKVSNSISSSQNTSKSNDKSIATELFIKSDKRLIQIQFSDIYFLESYGNYVKVWLKDEFHLTPASLSSFLEQLPSNDFFRIHKTYIINRLFIDYIEGNLVITKNGKSLPIGKMNRQAFRNFIGK